MAQDALEEKIQRNVNRGVDANEDETRALAVLIRKRLEVTPNRGDFSTLNLFCTWCVHTKITDSIPGLRTLVRVNNAVAKAIEKDKLGQRDGIIQEIIAAIGLETLRKELIAFLDLVGIAHRYGEDEIWAAFLTHLIEMIRDTPIKFRPLAEIKKMAEWQDQAKDAVKIYEEIAKTAFWHGSAVVSITVSDRDLGEEFVDKGMVNNLPKGLIGKNRYLVIETTNNVPMYVPFVWN